MRRSALIASGLDTNPGQGEDQRARPEKTQRFGELPKESISNRLYSFTEPPVVLGIVSDILAFLGTAASLASENENYDRFGSEGMQGVYWLVSLVEDMVGEVKEALEH